MNCDDQINRMTTTGVLTPEQAEELRRASASVLRGFW